MNNETVAPNRNCSVSPLADLESNSLSITVVSNRSSTENSTPNSTLHFTRPPAQSNVRLARFTSINNTTRNSATNFSFNETNLARISHSLELLDRKIENLANRREPAVQAAPTVSRDDIIVYSARFCQLFGFDEIYDQP